MSRATWGPSWNRCRICKSDDKPYYDKGMCFDCYQNSKDILVVTSYMQGENLPEIAHRLGVTISRVQQQLDRTIALEITKMGDDLTSEQKLAVRQEIMNAHKESRIANEFELVKKRIDKNYKQIIKKLSGDRVDSIVQLMKILGLHTYNKSLVESRYPEFIKLVLQNKKRWSKAYGSCRTCGTTSKKHFSWGYCVDCYSKSEEWKNNNAEYRKAHATEIREYTDKYNKENRERIKKNKPKYKRLYSQDPSVIEQYMQKYSNKAYGGNREKAFEKHGNKCHDCGTTRENNRIKTGKDLRITRIDNDKNNNDVSNLIPLCNRCNITRVHMANKLSLSE